MAKAHPRIGQVVVLDSGHFFVLHCLQKTLGLRVVLGAASATHTEAALMALQEIRVGGRGLLHPLLRVVDEARLDGASRQGLVERRDGQGGLPRAGKRPATTPPTIGVQHHRQINELPGEANRGEGGDPELSESAQPQRRHEGRRGRPPMVGMRRADAPTRAQTQSMILTQEP